MVDGVKREYLVYVPKNFDPAKKHPLVLAFHGGGGSAKRSLEFFGFNEVADTAGFLVVYPNGIKKGWNDGRQVKKHTHDDVGFIRKLIEQLKKNYLIDANKIFATGMSNGGLFSFTLGLKLSDQIKAIAPVCATIGMDTFNDYRPEYSFSCLLINGTDDPIVPYNGGTVSVKFIKRGQCTPTDATLARLLSLNSCDQSPAVKSFPDTDKNDGCTAEKFVYNCGQGLEVQFIKITGGGHTWPGGKQYLGKRLVGNVCRDFQAEKEIWNFFRQL
jgi:polyhydroxybutyrate depolymerase